jgi:hypothetical protein
MRIRHGRAARSAVARQELWSEAEIQRDLDERAAGFLSLPVDAPRSAKEAAAIAQGLALDALARMSDVDTQ